MGFSRERRVHTAGPVEKLVAVVLGGFLDFAATDAGSANAHAFGGAVNQCANGLQVEVPAPLGYVVRVADAVAKLRPTAANFTYSCHEGRNLLLNP